MQEPVALSATGSALLIWHRPTFERPCGQTIIGAGELNCRVRDGNGWDPAAMGARNLVPERDGEPELEPIAPGSFKAVQRRTSSAARAHTLVKNIRAISTGQLHTLRRFYLRPINVVVYHDSSPFRD